MFVFIEKQAALRELEGLLCDIDNARDFHTIGGWPVLASLLAPSEGRDSETQALAAWAIGSAVKNSYDYQLWSVEPLDFGNGKCHFMHAIDEATFLTDISKPSYSMCL